MNVLSSIMDRLVDNLLVRLGELGFQARIISVSHLYQLQKQIENLHNNASLDNQFYQDRLAWFNFQIPKDLPKTQSLIIVAVPRPQTRAIFTRNGQRHPLILPPTYTAYDSTTKQVEDLLAKILGENGYKSTGTALPLKLLAARSGLVQYGRNNISYVSGLGSFLQLAAVYSDMPCEEDSWQEATMMKRCEGCELCRRACPTCAIASDRFLLHAERCITYHNEKKGEVPFPDWMKPIWHNSIVGCMHCQRVCPENKGIIQWTGEEEEFSEEETALILEGIPQEKLPSITLQKLQHLSLVDYYDRLPRNLGILLARAVVAGGLI
jgi:epoxyqueuosine reductase